MKKTLTTLFVMFMYCSLHSQDSNTMAGDWIRLKAEYSDGGKIPDNHGAGAILRYYFTKKEVYTIHAGSTVPSAYTRTGNVFKIEPILVFVIEQYTDKALTLVEAEGPQPVRYYLIPTDSFQRSGIMKYPFEVINSDTIYIDQLGIGPIYPKGNDFMKSIMTGFTQKVAFDFTYVVRNNGTIGDVTIIDSSTTNPKLHKRLIELVKKTSGNWIPATYKGKPVHVLLRSSFLRK